MQNAEFKRQSGAVLSPPGGGFQSKTSATQRVILPLGHMRPAQAVITGTYEIPPDMHPATKLILEELGRLGMKLINEEGTEIIITPEDFKHF
jgi:hypothetical protein